MRRKGKQETLMANRPPSDDPGSKPEVITESKGALRQWTEGMRLEVLANLAHELRTPLQVLIGYLDILRDEWAEKFDPESLRWARSSPRLALRGKDSADTFGG
jgi:signal transduction histidine kinase